MRESATFMVVIISESSEETNVCCAILAIWNNQFRKKFMRFENIHNLYHKSTARYVSRKNSCLSTNRHVQSRMFRVLLFAMIQN